MERHLRSARVVMWFAAVAALVGVVGCSSAFTNGVSLPINGDTTSGALTGTTHDSTGPVADDADASSESIGSPEEGGLPADSGSGTETEVVTSVAEGETPAPDATTGDEGEATQVQSGLLTAGSFDDNLNLTVFEEFMAEAQQEALAAQQEAASSGWLDAFEGALPPVTLGQRALISVLNDSGVPVGNARVAVRPADAAADSAALIGLPTGSDGRVVFATGWDGGGSATAFLVTVAPPSGDPVTASFDVSSLGWSVTLPGAAAPLPSALDLAFVVDVTGSMGDELEYLKAELSDIAGTVQQRFPTVTQRYALIVYRDEGDEFVTRTFDFTADLAEFQTNLSLQSSSGGGDYPEAVHTALAAADGLSWSTDASARMLFWVADAPPHADYAQAALDAVAPLRARAVSFYPVAASGVATEAEYIMRTAALLTLGQYLFLTDDSGIGLSHAEPHIPCYVVQYLNHVMIRMITTELSGERVEASSDQIIRTVGNPVNGVCVEEPVPDQQQQTPDDEQSDEQTTQ